MATTTEHPQGAPDQIQTEPLGEHGEPCAGCGAPMAADQRYCLNCGARRGPARLPFDQWMDGAARGAGSAPPRGPAAPANRPNDFSPLGAVLGVAVLGALLLIGVLIGRGDGDDSQTPVVAAAPGEEAAAAGGEGQTVSSTDVQTDWPEGQEGWTVELGTLPKEGTTGEDVEATKADLESKGAKDLGVLLSDDYASLPPGNYVIYSGVHESEKDAQTALKDLQSDFPDARVIEVSQEEPSEGGGGGGLLGGGKGEGTVEASEEDLQELDSVTGEEYQDKLDEIPDEISTPGEPPPVDSEGEPGAGSEAEVIE
jgi:hypothetical protein